MLTLQLHTAFVQQGNCVAVPVTNEECRVRPQVVEGLCSEMWSAPEAWWHSYTDYSYIAILPPPPQRRSYTLQEVFFVAFCPQQKHSFCDPVFVLFFHILSYQMYRVFKVSTVVVVLYK